MLKTLKKRKYHRSSTMSREEVIMIIILFHDSGYRCLKHFYLERVCKHMSHLFPQVVYYNRFVEIKHEVAIPLALFIEKVLWGKCTGISFVDSTPLRVCKNQIIHIHKVFKGIAQGGTPISSLGLCRMKYPCKATGSPPSRGAQTTSYLTHNVNAYKSKRYKMA